VLGALSLIFWTLVIITTVKYVTVAMSIDNDGEGGVLALMALLGIEKRHRPGIIALGLCGGALIYGDGAITPAISVLSALEGLNIVAPSFRSYVLPVAVGILVALFAVQPLGTAWIGRAFGPVMAVWFLVMAALGVWGIAQHPAVLAAVNPFYGLDYLVSNGLASFLVLGGVFLCVTGAEALYADMGHSGSRPIRLAWSAVVFPSLVLNYAGQAALVLKGAPISDNIFYQLCPTPLLIPMVMLSTVATVIASQSIITGAFSMTRQAIQLGWMPRLRITQTSEQGYGPIYIGAVNWLLMIVTVGLAIGFGKSANLAAAYGIAVSATMLITSVLLFIAMREIWGWNLLLAGAVAGVFVCVDSAFVVANSAKFFAGGYVPILLAAAVYTIMTVWHRGSLAMLRAFADRGIPIDHFMASVAAQNIPRVPGTAVFLTRILQDTPPMMVWHVKQNRALHKHVLVLSVQVESVPWIAEADRLSITREAPDVWRAVSHFGFMERPDIPALIAKAGDLGCTIDRGDVTYYVGHETIIRRDNGQGLPAWEERLFATMERNAVHVTDFFRLPDAPVVEIGRHVAI